MEKTDWKEIHQTPRGTAVYPKLIEPDTKFNAAGVYSVRMKFHPEAEAALVQKHDKHYEQAYGQNCKKLFTTQLKKAEQPWTPDRNDNSLVFNFKMTASGVDEAGKPWARRPQIFDARGHEVTDTRNLRIGSGTEMLVMYRVMPFFTALVGSGISLRLVGVRIFKLLDWKRDAGFFGFREEEGWDSQAPNEPTVEPKAPRLTPEFDPDAQPF
jgi:hypothetical protein